MAKIEKASKKFKERKKMRTGKSETKNTRTQREERTEKEIFTDTILRVENERNGKEICYFTLFGCGRKYMRKE